MDTMHTALEKEQAAYKAIPAFRKVDDAAVQRNYQEIKQDVQDIVETEMDHLLNDPAKHHLLIKK